MATCSESTRIGVIASPENLSTSRNHSGDFAECSRRADRRRTCWVRAQPHQTASKLELSSAQRTFACCAENHRTTFDCSGKPIHCSAGGWRESTEDHDAHGGDSHHCVRHLLAPLQQRHRLVDAAPGNVHGGRIQSEVCRLLHGTSGGREPVYLLCVRS